MIDEKGTCAPAAAAFLHDCRKARLALFGTAGFGISEMYFASLSDRFRAVVPGDSRVLGSFFCPGKMPEAVRDRYPADSRRGLDAYLFGFICHYALDSAAHGTVYKGIRETGVSHTAIESDFDRALLLEDGFEPAGQPLAGHIVPSVGNAAVISRFFPTVTALEVEKSLSSMRFFHSLLLAPGKGKRSLLQMGLSAAGKAPVAGMIVQPDPNPACAAVVETLREKFEEGLPLAVQLIETAFTPGWLSDGRMELDFESDRH